MFSCALPLPIQEVFTLGRGTHVVFEHIPLTLIVTMFRMVYISELSVSSLAEMGDVAHGK